MNAADHPRPVWLTRDHRDLLNDFLVTDVVAAWDAAPADPSVAASLAVDNHLLANDGGEFTGFAVGHAVLRALGMPEVTA